MRIYDVIIIGAGSAGMFSAIKLANKGLNILIVDKGQDLDNRIKELGQKSFSPIGWGGAGTGSDGKLIFSKTTGGRLNQLIPDNKLSLYLEESRNIWNNFIGDLEVERFDKIKDLSLINKAFQLNLDLEISDIIHVGSDLLPKVLYNMRKFIQDSKVDILMENEIKDIKIEKDYFIIDEFKAKNVIISPGRGGAQWLKRISEKLEINNKNVNVDVGVRVEIPFEVTRDLTDKIYEFKIKYITPSYKDEVRTFCVNPGGFVVEENYGEKKLVNGYSNKNFKSDNTNFAFLSSIRLTDPINDPLNFSDNIIKTVNSIAKGVMVQRLGDLLNFRRSRDLSNNSVRPSLDTAFPGDLSLAIPYRFLENIKEGLFAIDKMCPGIYDENTLLYAPEIKLYSSMIDVNENMETKYSGLYVAGDGAGISKGIVQACISGLIAADSILKKKNVY